MEKYFLISSQEIPTSCNDRNARESRQGITPLTVVRKSCLEGLDHESRLEGLRSCSDTYVRKNKTSYPVVTSCKVPLPKFNVLWPLSLYSMSNSPDNMVDRNTLETRLNVYDHREISLWLHRKISFPLLRRSHWTAFSALLLKNQSE